MRLAELSWPARLAGIAAVLGGLAAVTATSDGAAGARVDLERLAREVATEADHIGAVELARWIRDGGEGLRLIDLRAPEDFTTWRIPKARRVPIDSLAELVPAPDEEVILYSDGGVHAAQAWFFLRATGHRARFLRGGFAEWLEEVMSPTLAPGATAADSAAFREKAELARYFGGAPDDVPSGPAPGAPHEHADEHERTRAEAQRLRRRSC